MHAASHGHDDVAKLLLAREDIKLNKHDKVEQ
jgi:hypothetical protein